MGAGFCRKNVIELISWRTQLEIYIKMDSSEVECENVDQIQLILVNVQVSFMNTDKFSDSKKM